MADGLPGNNLFEILRDKRGFIWIGSENGLVRFDGNNFRIYRISEGLPDNEINGLRLDANGIIHAIPYRDYPSTYNPVTDRFEQGKRDQALGSLSIRAEQGVEVLEDGSLAVYTSNGAANILQDRRTISIAPIIRNGQLCQPYHCLLLGKDRFQLVYQDSLRVFEGPRLLYSNAYPFPDKRAPVYLNHCLFTCDTAAIYKTRLNNKGEILSIQRIFLPGPSSHISFTGKHLALIQDNGTTLRLLDTATLNEVAQMPLNSALATAVMEDEEQQVWVTTTNQGLLRLSQGPVINYNSLLPPGMAPSTVAVDSSVFLCGDDKGRIVIFRKGCVEQIISINQWSKAISRVRNILVLKDGYYIAVEGDASLLLDKKYGVQSVYNRPLLNFTDRCAALWHDSIILAGSHNGALKFRYKACQEFDAVNIRSTAIGADPEGRMIIGSLDGCYRKDDTGLYAFGKTIPELARRVNVICSTPDGLVWVGMSNKVLVALKNGVAAGMIHLGAGLPGNGCNTLCAGKSGELWLGTDLSLNRIRYSIVDDSLHYQACSFSAADGVPGQVSAIAWHHDSVYVATSQGLFSMPGDWQPLVRDIPVYITGIRINDRDTFLYGNWELPYGMNNIDIRYAGIDMSGFEPVFQYRINEDAWQDVGDDHLALKRLAPGIYRVQIRAMRRDGSPSPLLATLHIRLHAPFWISIWFWLGVLAVLIIGFLVLLQWYQRRKRNRQLQKLKAEHELVTSQQQTFSALMNPHFIFNALNSIQHYVLAQDKRSANRYLSGFGRLIRMNFESAQKTYISLEEELERLQLYLSLEKMRFGDQLSYQLDIADDIQQEDWMIPAMILQPFVENALLHGIAPLREPGHVDISVRKDGHTLIVSITDNGIGMEQSSRQKSGEGHVSRSMDLITKRIEVLRKLRHQLIGLKVEPAFPDNESHPGTRVILVFPEHLESGEIH